MQIFRKDRAARRPDAAVGIRVVISRRDDNGLAVPRKCVLHSRYGVGAYIRAVKQVARNEHGVAFTLGCQLHYAGKYAAKPAAPLLAALHVERRKRRIKVKITAVK